MDLVTEPSTFGLTSTAGSPESNGRPWSKPGPEAHWWHGDTTEVPEVLPARHREPEPSPPDEPVWPAPELLAGRAPRTVVDRPRRPRRYRPMRRPGAGLVALLALGLLAIFFAWVSAEPAWLALGHGTRGTATVAACTVHGIPKRCADFTADGGTFAAERVTLLGTGPDAPPVGGKLTARMVSARGSAAYAGSVRLRLGLGLLGVIICGLAVAWLTGTFRLPTRRARLVGLGFSLAGPVVLTGLVLAATW